MDKARLDAKTLVDPALRPMLEYVLKLIPPDDGTVGAEQIAAMRARSAAMQKPFLDTPHVASRSIPVPGRGDELTVFVINADAGVARPAILHIHGGGFVSGSAAGSVADMQVVARALDCVVVTVDYRLAPEATFRQSCADNSAALSWLHAEAASLGVDRARIAVLGDSAGGGHAALLAIGARDRGETPLCLQALSYPMLDDRTGTTVQPPPHVGAFMWRAEANRAGWSAFLGCDAGSPDVPAAGVPARTADLAGLPPTFIAIGSIDLFVAEDIDYARRLIEAGVPTELLVVPGAYHAFDAIVPAADVSRRYRLALLNALARAFGRPLLTQPPEPAPLGFSLTPDEDARQDAP